MLMSNFHQIDRLFKRVTMLQTQEFGTLTNDLISQISAIVGESNCSTADIQRELHSKDQSMFPPTLPDVVVWVETAEQVSEILILANTHRIPVTPWGVGTSLEGNPMPIHGGILISFQKMADVVEVHADDFQVTVQPGIGYKDLNEKLARYGLFFPPDPGANATIGGMIANNAAGIRTVKYGATRDNVLSLQVVLADGRILRLGSRSVKQSSGYDLVHLMIGSEGTLGIVIEATLKLAPIAEHKIAVQAVFETVAQAVETVVAIRGSGLDPVALEFIDRHMAWMMNNNPNVELEEKPQLFMEFHATHEDALEQTIVFIREICEDIGATKIHATADSKKRANLWYARHHAFESFQRAHPNKRAYLNDVAVPISVYPELVNFIHKLRETAPIPAYMLGHAGDGNIHVVFPFGDDDEYQIASELNARIVEKAISMGGTATGEHGVGMGKIRFMKQEHGEAFEVMRSIKQVLDPNGIMNPGKIFRD
jgi:D-lactate dehydrogenase (cytochrome)